MRTSMRICAAVALAFAALPLAADAESGSAPAANLPERMTLHPPCPDDLSGVWRGALPAASLLDTRIVVSERADGGYVADIDTRNGTESVRAWIDGPYLRFQAGSAPLSFRGAFSRDGRRLEGFLQYGSSLVRVSLEPGAQAAGRSWSIDWSPLAAREPELTFDLYIGDDGEGGIGGYFFFRDQRLPGLWGYGLRCEDGTIALGERSLGLEFSGRLDDSRDRLLFTVQGPAGSTSMTFDRLPDDQVPSTPDEPEAPPRASGSGPWSELAPDQIGDGWPTSTPSAEGMSPSVLGEMIEAVEAGELEFTHSVLVARYGKLVLEEYFYGFDRDIRHDMRSASKSVASTLVGLAIREKRIAGSGARALPYLSHYRWYDNWDDRKNDITIGHLLTMSSGLDARDWEPESVASEGAYQSQTMQPDWVKYALDAPMLWDPGTHVYYGGANPLILGGVLASVVGEPVEWFSHRLLFGPLGVHDYRFLLDPLGVPYMGGGMYMRPRDMLKYGQLYLDGGVWQGKRILSEAWVHESFGKYGRLEPIDRNGHQYGYLWWHHQYEVGDEVIETVEARGNGGQYIFVVPSLELVAVITSGNFRNGRLRQPEEILGRWILPAATGAIASSGERQP